ncbi:hypothetical protein [Metabacillus fastidiosus]|uniref:hypothetical protein n=1 Tax=Metabacillus fastidiosus TaxID=1458 RepID=UPI003D2B996D
MEVTFVTTPDGEWEMLFINGELEKDGHSIYTPHLLGSLKEHLPATITKIEVKELTWDALNRYDYEFPIHLVDYNEEDFA